MKTKTKLLTIFLFLFFLFSLTEGKTKGKLFIIGGGSETEELLQKFVDLAGGKEAKIVIFPMASSIPDTVGLEYERDFKNYKTKAFSLNINREEANSEKILSKLKNVTGVFFTGGDQVRLMEVLRNTKVEKRIKEIYSAGGVIGGTSAGAAVMSEIMITGNELINKDSTSNFSMITKHNVETKIGFGFLTNAIIDQHFIVRKRHNRLITLVLENPNLIGIGIDESTAIVVYPNHTFEVLGKSLVMIYDASTAKNIYTNKENNISARGIKVSILKDGDTFKMKK